MKRSAALFLLVPFLLAGCAQGPGSALLPGAGPAFSTLDASGVEKIKADKKAVLDMRSGKLTRDAAGLDGDTEGSRIEVPEGLDLTIVGPKGSVEARTTAIGFATVEGDPDVAGINYDLAADSNEVYFAMLNDGVKKYGIPGFATSQWIRGITKEPDFSGTFDLGTGRSPGVEVSYKASYDAADGIRGVQVHVAAEPQYAPAAAVPFTILDWEKDPMSQYVESITTPEEKVARLRAYTALPEILNSASPVHETPTSVYQDLFEKGVITAGYRDQNKEQTEWGTGQYPSRNAGYTYQVTGIYCPMHEQLLAVLDRGFLGCTFTGNYMHNGETVSKSAAESVTGWKTPAPDEYQHARVYMKKDGDTWKVDNIRLD